MAPGSTSGTGYSRSSNSPPYALRTAMRPFMSPSSSPAHGRRLSLARRQVLEGLALVHADVGRQPEDALGDDVLEDLIGAGGDARARRRQHRVLKRGAHRHQLGIAHHAAHIHEI